MSRFAAGALASFRGNQKVNGAMHYPDAGTFWTLLFCQATGCVFSLALNLGTAGECFTLKAANAVWLLNR